MIDETLRAALLEVFHGRGTEQQRTLVARNAPHAVALYLRRQEVSA